MTLNSIFKVKSKNRKASSEGGLLEAAYNIVGDGVARADIKKLVQDEGFQESVARLSGVRLYSEGDAKKHPEKG